MKAARYLASFVALAIALSLSAFAKDRDSGSFDLAKTAHVGSAVLQPGHYKAEWTGPNNALHISILENGKTVATVTGRMKELSTKPQNDSVTVKKLKNNTARVEEIDFHNRTDALVFSR